MTIGWLDPSLCSRNTGDQIIAESVHRELIEMFPDLTIFRLPTQRRMTRPERAKAKACDHFVIGGTNILNSNVPRYIQWKLDPLSVGIMKRQVSLMGVGWWKYQNKPNRLTEGLWRLMLSSNVHSVRDTYTRDKLESIGIGAIMTACPTMWRLPSRIPLPARKSAAVVTLTDYHRDRRLDSTLLETLFDLYDDVHVWPQGSKDAGYVRSLNDRVELLGTQLSDFDTALESGAYDYVGTRLHAGVRALQKGVRTAILAIDNRASELGRETGLPILPREFTIEQLGPLLESDFQEIRLPSEDIAVWRQQFKSQIIASGSSSRA